MMTARAEISKRTVNAVGIIACCCIMAMSVRPVVTGWSSEDVLFHVVLVVLGILATVCVLPRRCMPTWHRLDSLVLLWLVYATVNYCFLSPYHAETKYLIVVTNVLLYATLRLLSDACRLHSRWIVLFLALAGCYEAVLGGLQLYDIAAVRHVQYVVTGTFPNPGPYSAYIVTALSVCSAYMYRRYGIYGTSGLSFHGSRCGKAKVVYAVCVLTVLLGLLILPSTLSRAAFVSYAVVLAVLCYRRHRKVVLVGAIVALLAGIVFYVIKQGSADGRLLIWIVSASAIADNWLTGVGMGGFQQAFAQCQAAFFDMHPASAFVSVAGSPEYAFNELLHVGVEQGVVGMCLFLSVAVVSVYSLFRRQKELACGWLALLVFSMFSYPFSLLPFRILGVLFVAQAAGVASRRMVCAKGIFSYSPVMFGVSITVVASLLLPVIKHKVDATQGFNQINGLQFEAFEDDYRGWEKWLSDNPGYLFAYGKGLNDMKRYEESNAILKRGEAVSCDPMFQVIIGNNYKAQGKPEEAEKAYRKAFEILPNRLYPLYRLMLLYEDCGCKDKARAMALEIISFVPKVSSRATDEMKKHARELIGDKTRI